MGERKKQKHKKRVEKLKAYKCVLKFYFFNCNTLV